MPRKKKEYICKVCGKKYFGYRKSGTCSPKCGLKAMLEVISRLKNPNSTEFQKARLRGEEMRRQFIEKKGEWFEKWRAGVLKVAKKLKK